MKKIYLIQHSFNKSCEPCGFFEVVSAHSTKEKAIAKIEEINSSIENGESFYFPKTKVKGEEYKGFGGGYTYEWRDDAGNQMFTHFMIIEKDFD